MKAQYIKQITKEDVLNTKFDLVIVSSGYEKRASFIAKLISQNTNKGVAFAFTDYKDHPIRKENDEIFKSLNYTILEVDGNNSTEIRKKIENYLSNNNIINILIDYSSMTRIWYSSIINYFRDLEIDDRILRVYYTYSCADFYKPEEKSEEKKDKFKLSHFDPIEDFFYLSPSDVPSALITCLGAEPNKTYGLKEYFDAELLFLFYSENNEFSEFIKEKNRDLLEDTTSDTHKIPYFLDDILFTKTILYDLCKALMKDHRVIIAPCGPKVFTLISLLVASELEEVDVWRISGNLPKSDDPPIIASGKIISCEICYKK